MSSISNRSSATNNLSLKLIDDKSDQASVRSDAPFIPKVTLSVMNLKYAPTPMFLNKAQSFFMSKFQSDEAAQLENVTFSVNSGELMAILAPNVAERRTLMELISNRRRYGEFDGEVMLSQSGVETDASGNKAEYTGGTTARNSIAFVPRDAVSLYLPGLTYYESLSFAARLRMRNVDGLTLSQMSQKREQRIADILEIMKLTWCRDRVIAERPTARGVLGGELRKMSVAVEIVALPPVIMLDDITEALDHTVSTDIVNTLRTLSLRGHTVVCSFAKVYPKEMAQFNKITLISRGYSVFSASPTNIAPYFTEIGYSYNPSTDLGDYLLDIGSGTERQRGERVAPTGGALQATFEESDYYDQFRQSSGHFYSTPVITTEGGWKNIYDFDFFLNLRNGLIIFERAWYCKLKEREVIKQSISANIFLSVFFGYFCWQMASGMEYLLAFIPFPYSETSTMTSVMYIATTCQIAIQVLNVHIIYQKQKVFLYERESGVASTFSFLIASVVSEVPMAAVFTLLFSTILYYMLAIGEGVDNFLFWTGVLQMSCYIGVLTVLLFTSNIRNEIAVRDFFLYCLVTMVWTGGFMYPPSVLRDWVVKVANINPMRWLFRSVMVWFYEDFPDGELYLSTYDYQGDDKNEIWMQSLYFIIFGVGMYYFGLLRGPSTLRRFVTAAKESTASRDSETEADFKFSQKLASQHPERPSIMSRDSSFSTHSPHLSSQASTIDDSGIERGPRVTFVNLGYQVEDRSAPLGKKTIIHTMSGVFDWGKLGVILGAEGSGKSSLLHILGGQTLASNAELKGQIYHNERAVEDLPLLPWQRCAFIEALDEHFRDLSVLDILTFAMLLRTVEELSEDEMAKNVQNSLKLLQLEEVKNKKAKLLTAGELRRLTIAEDIVHGPHLILMDEPITGLDVRESSIIMTQTVRELVNQDRTVILTLYQPTAAVFEICDTVALLSKGRLIYMGAASEAAKFFIESPNLTLQAKEWYDNPAEFLYDLSANFAKDYKNDIVDATRLENNYRGSTLYSNFAENQMKTFLRPPSVSDRTSNPLNVTDGAGGNEIHDTDDTEEDLNQWRYATALDNHDRSRSRSVSRLSHSRAASVTTSVGNSFWLLFRKLLIPLITSFHDIRNMNVKAQLRKANVLQKRGFFSLVKREKLWIGTTLMYVYLAVFTCIILKDNQNNNAAVVTPLAMFGAFLLLISQLQYMFFLFHNQKVFLKEHSRGLYSGFLRWCVEDKTLSLLRICQILLFSVIVHEWIGLQGGDRAVFFYIMFVAVTMAFGDFIVIVVSTIPDLRSGYGSVTGTALFLFVFSGLILKPDLYPWYLAPWLPSVSMIRWFAQGLIINEFDDNEEAFPPIPLLGGESAYPLYLSLFGWGGQTKWYCMAVVFMNMAIFKLLSLFATWKAVIVDKGTRCMRRKEAEEGIF